LSRHPSIAPPLRKEPQYFTLHNNKGDAWYRAHFPTAAARRAHERRTGEPLLTFEATPYYLYHPDAPGRAARTVPEAKLVALLRNPVDRAFSHYQHTRSRGLEPLSFGAALDAETDRLASSDASQRLHSYVSRGRYADQLARWLDQFPRPQVLVLRSEDLFDDMAAAVARVVEFLGLSAMPAVPLSPAAAARPRLDDPVRERLRGEFAASNRALADLLGTDLWWHD
jgi:sulfotransferase family protein